MFNTLVKNKYSLTKLLSTFVLLASISPSSIHAKQAIKIIFLPESVAGGFDHAGPMPLLQPLEDYISKEYNQYYVPMKLGRLIKKNILPYYIYNKKYCKPIKKELGANTFVMAQINFSSGLTSIDARRFDVEVKVYTFLNKKEMILFKKDNMKIDDVDDILKGKEQLITNKILTFVKEKI